MDCYLYVLSRQRLTAGALVCDQLNMHAFNKLGRVAFVHRHASGPNYKAENSAFSVEECSAALYFEQGWYFLAVSFVQHKDLFFDFAFLSKLSSKHTHCV